MLNASLTIGSDTFNRLGNDLTKGVFGKTGEDAGHTNTLTIQQGTAVIGKTKVFRRNVRRDLAIVDENGLSHEMAAYIVIQHGNDALITETVVKDVVLSLCALLTASSAAALIQIINGEV
jgi:hypothetical protein